MTKIFISYRRQDTKPTATLIYRPLAAHFEALYGPGAVFMDIYGIPKGRDFHDYLTEQVSKAEVLLALIADRWLTVADEQGRRRLDSPDDFVRIEIEAALARRIPIIPVYVDGVRPVRAEDLPESLKPLARRNGAFLDTGIDFDAHIKRLIADIEPHLGGNPAAQLQIGVSVSQAVPPPQSDPNRVRIAAPITEGVRDGWFTPGNGRTEWFRDHELGPEMVVIPARKFMMGTTDAEIAALTASYGDHFKDEAPQHEVTISQPFAVGRFAVTFDEWEAAQCDGSWPRVTGLPPRQPSDKEGWGRGRRPVIDVSWEDAQAYLKWLSAKTGQKYRLLSEAEWEYACRAGSETAFWWGDTISASQANYDATNVYWGGSAGEYRKKTVPVDQFQPNPWGLYQMHGNVWEWCEDCWNASYAGKPASLKASGGPWTTGECDRRVLRGGSWYDVPLLLRSAIRIRGYTSSRSDFSGFRVARTITP